MLQIIRTELTAIKARFGDPRRTQISAVANEIDMEDLIQEEDMAVTMTHFGYIKRLSADTYRTQNRAGKGVIGLSTRDEDFVENIFVTSTHNHILFFTNMGRAYPSSATRFPRPAARPRARPSSTCCNWTTARRSPPPSRCPATPTGSTSSWPPARAWSEDPALGFDNIRKGGLIAVNLREDDELIGVCLSGGDAEILLGTRQGMCIRFSERDVRPMGRPSTGVRGIDLAQGDEVVGMGMVLPGAEVLSIAKRGYGKRTAIEEFRVQSRGGKGIKAMNLTDKTGELADIELVYPDQDLMMISNDGTVIRIPVASISPARPQHPGRDAHAPGRGQRGGLRRAGGAQREAELPDHEPSEEAELPDPEQPDADPVETLAQDDFTPRPRASRPSPPPAWTDSSTGPRGRDPARPRVNPLIFPSPKRAAQRGPLFG